MSEAFKSRTIPNTDHMREKDCPAPWMRCFSVTEIDCTNCSINNEYNSSEQSIIEDENNE